MYSFRISSLSSPFLLGFDEIERVLDRVTRSADGYPPYNIERVARDEANPERLRITLAVAGFTRDQLDVTLEENQLVIRGRQQDDKSRQYLHRGIAARQFQRSFVLADGMEVQSADLRNGLLSIDLIRPGVTPDEVASVWPDAQEFGYRDEDEAFLLQYGHGV